MKKLFTLLAAALMSVCMMAQTNLFDAASTTLECWSQPGWAEGAINTTFATYNAGTVTVNVPGACGAQWQCQVKLHTTGITLDPAKNYEFKCDINSNNAFGGITLKLFNSSILSDKNDYAVVSGNNNIATAAFVGGDAGDGVIVFDFGYAPANTVMTISNITLQESTAPVIQDPKPTTAPAAPTLAANAVASVYSDSYPAAAPFGYCENWGQSTTLEELNLDGNHVLYYKNFSYLGWGSSSSIDASDYSSLHFDIWAATAGNLRIYPIYGGDGLNTDDTHGKVVTLAEGWNAVDFDLATDFPGLNLYSIFQFKFDNGSSSFYAIDNVYFYGKNSDVEYTTLANVYNKANKDTVILKDFEVVYVNGGYCYIKDATASGLIFKNNYGLVAGDKVARGMVCTVSIYNNLYELVPVTAKADLSVTPGTPAEPVMATAAPTAGDNKYVIYKNVTFLKDSIGTIATADRTAPGLFGKDTIVFYNTFKVPAVAFETGKKYDVVGCNTVYKTTVQVAVVSITEHPQAIDECAGEHGLYDPVTAAINHTYLAPNWGLDPGATAEISNGVVQLHFNQAMGDMWNGQVFVNPGFTFEPGHRYHYEFDLQSTGKVCITVKVNDNDKYAFYSQSFYDFNIGGGTWHFSTDSVMANDSLAAARGPLVFGFGWCDANNDITISCIKITDLGEYTPKEEKMFIKHPWGTGADADWTWQEMADTTYMNVKGWYTTGAWGGVGINIADNAEGNDAKWFPESAIRFLDMDGVLKQAPAVGTQGCTFIYVPMFDNGGVIPCSYVILPNEATSLDDIKVEDKAVKFIENGKLYIRRGEHVFDAQGVMVK